MADLARRGLTRTALPRRPRARQARQRALQVGFAAAAVLAVAVAERAASGLLAGTPGADGARTATAVVVGGHALGGWALGMALRLQFARAVEVDRTVRVLLGIPACLLATWPLTATYLPPALLPRLPAWLAAGAADVSGFAAAALGLVLALGVTPAPGRR